MKRPNRLPIALLLVAVGGVALINLFGDTAHGADPAEAARVQATVDALRPIVSRIRGLPWKQPVPAKLMSREELRLYLKKELDKEVTPAEWVRDNRIMKRLGLLKPNEDLRALIMNMYESSIAGLYDPVTKRLFVVEGHTGDAQKPVMVHELIHALEDQHYDLEKLEKPYRDDDPDRVFAQRCLWEGSAEYGRRLYQDEFPAVARAFYRQQRGSKAQFAEQNKMFAAVPTHVLLGTMLHYRMGPNFVTQALENDYRGGMQKLIQDMPTTQEQFLHPWKWLGANRDYPRTIAWGADLAAAAGPGWKRLDEHSVGELDLSMFLDFFLGDRGGRINPETLIVGQYIHAFARKAAEGWDAGRALYLDGPKGHLTIVMAYAFDSIADAREAARCLGSALRGVNRGGWKGHGWTTEDEDTRRRHYDYTGLHGRGRIGQRGRHLLVLDGALKASFDGLWAALDKTVFKVDPRDRGDDPVDPFAGYALVDEHRGLGLKLPSAAWEAEASADSKLSFAAAKKGSVTVKFLVIDQEVTFAGLVGVGKLVAGRKFKFKEQLAKPAQVMNVKGLVHPIPARPGTKRWIYLASDAARTYVMFVSGRKAEIEAARDDIALLLAGVRPPRDHGPGGRVIREAGIRSIPGY